MQPELRHAPRYPFVATAELVEVQSDTRVHARTCELSLHGCYLDLMNPLPVATQFKLRITHQNATFEALGRAAYSQPNMGMGVAFTAIEPDSQALLQKWIRELSGD